MKARMEYFKASPGVYQILLSAHKFLQSSGPDETLLDLVYVRASQINHCAYCVDMHWKDAREAGETEQRLYMLSAWREWQGYTDRERAALGWTEAVTLVTDGFVPDEVYQTARDQFSEAELANLTLAVTAINSWNRFNVAFRTEAGGYKPVKRGKSASS